MKVLYLSYQQWDNRLKTIETKNLKQYHRTPSWLSIGYELKPCILETQDGKIIVIDEDKYKELRKYCLSEDYVLKNKVV